jgi:hypothetical protein
VARASLAAADTHPKERYALRGQLAAPPVRVLVEGVAAVDERIARGEMRREEINGFVDGAAGGDHHENAARRLQRCHEGGSVVVAGHVRCHACGVGCCKCCAFERVVMRRCARGAPRLLGARAPAWRPFWMRCGCRAPL